MKSFEALTRGAAAPSARLLRHVWFAAFLALPIACSGSSTNVDNDTDAGKDGGDGDGGSCGHLGDSCTSSCADGLTCEGNDPQKFCGPERGCGGIVDTGCPDPAQHCVLLGTERGICLTDEEKACVCDKTPKSFVDCKR